MSGSVALSKVSDGIRIISALTNFYFFNTLCETADKSSDKVREIVEKFVEQDCNSLVDVLTAKYIFNLNYLTNKMNISPGVGGRIVKSLYEMAKPNASSTFKSH